MLTIFAFIFTIGLLVTIHEYGHFIVARLFNVKVIRFAIGFGHPIWKMQFGKDRTELIIGSIPLGGYVKMLDENEIKQESAVGEVSDHYSEKELSRAFNRLPVIKRMAVVLAGPFANLLLAILLYWFLFSLGIVGLKPIVGEVTTSSPAALAGFTKGDLIKSVNGEMTHSWQDFRWLILNEMAENKPVRVAVVSEKNNYHEYDLSINSLNQEDTQTDLITQLGLGIYQPVVKPTIGEITQDGAAFQAGLISGDIIISVDDVAIDTWEAFVTQIRMHPNKMMKLLVDRDHQTISINITPSITKESDEIVGKIGAGVYFSESEINHYLMTSNYTVMQSLIKAIDKTYQTSIFSLKMMGNMLIGNISWKMMSGPVTIANYAGQSANMGLKVFIGFLAMISISIGVLNLLPIPVLDGGHFMYYVIEMVTGQPVSDGLMQAGQKIGLFLIATMMIMAFFNDINRLITG
jgi:regulator of sigma E protease